MTSRILVSLSMAATPERAFAVFTEEIGAWWRANALFAFTPAESRGDPGRLAFEPGPTGRLIVAYQNGKALEIGKVRVWSPPERLAFDWRQASFAPGQITRVEVRFEPVGEAQTRVTVEHLGWDSVPAGHVARHGFPEAAFLRRHAEWWRDLLGAFAERLEARG